MTTPAAVTTTVSGTKDKKAATLSPWIKGFSGEDQKAILAIIEVHIDEPCIFL